MKCEDCKFYHEVAYKWGECLHYPCMAEPSDPACDEFEAKIVPVREIDRTLDELFKQFIDTGIVPEVKNDYNFYVVSQLEYILQEYLKNDLHLEWPQIEAVVYNRTHRLDISERKIYELPPRASKE